MPPTKPPPSTARRLARQWGPWGIGLVIVLLLARKMPLSAFREALSGGPHVQLVCFEVLLVLVTLCTDAVATWFAMLAVRLRRPIGQILAVRGATFVLFLINYALGQGGFGYYLHRTGVSTLRATGATLFLIGTNLATMLVLTTVAWGVRGVDFDNNIWRTLIGGCIAFAVYLVVIVARPAVIARREIFAPLFDAGLRGHGIAILGRVPHMAVVTLGPWIALRVWGIPVPPWAALTAMPLVVIATALPISPAGLGTTQAALIYFFSLYANGATAGEREAHVFAFSIVHFVYMVLATLVVGLACIPFAKRINDAPAAR